MRLLEFNKNTTFREIDPHVIRAIQNSDYRFFESFKYTEFFQNYYYDAEKFKENFNLLHLSIILSNDLRMVEYFDKSKDYNNCGRCLRNEKTRQRGRIGLRLLPIELAIKYRRLDIVEYFAENYFKNYKFDFPLITRCIDFCRYLRDFECEGDDNDNDDESTKQKDEYEKIIMYLKNILSLLRKKHLSNVFKNVL